jgi:glycogen operon protein
MSEPTISAGRPHPLGATIDNGGVNFAVYAENATSVELLLFDAADDPKPAQTITLDPTKNRTFHVWHVHVGGVGASQVYGYRVDGPIDPSQGHRFNRNKVLVDPYSRGNVDAVWERHDAVGDTDNVATSIRSMVIDVSDYDWEGDQPLKRPMAESVIYEMHVRGFTRSPTSGSSRPGTFSAVIDKIPHLQQLGVTAIELLPIFDFDHTEVLRSGPDGQPLHNYWGYDPFSYFAPQSWYCFSPEEGAHIREFRDMVKALHKAGIEVILDVVYNHTSEGNELGPTISFRGFENSTYYLLEQDRQYYQNHSGCGNAVNANHPIVSKLIIESLEYWVLEHHVDGFRFDLGSVLSRGPDGRIMEFPPVLWNIELSERLADTKVIAEAWDLGEYQLGHFPGSRWAEWNGKYRDDVRRFVRGDYGLVSAMATRLAGSSDLFEQEGERPTNSINFITAHDGFTLNDLVSYNEKHNEANGENNRDGTNDNNSSNYGVEGPSRDPALEALRERQIRNFLSILLLSQGVPMLLGGDEFRRTQHGNNNAYCQDSELVWFDWDLVREQRDLIRFVSELTALRAGCPALHRAHWFSGAVNDRGLADITWHGTELDAPDWGGGSRVLAFTLGGEGEDPDVHVMLNMHTDGLDFELPTTPGRRWHLSVDTASLAPGDIASSGAEAPVDGTTRHVHGRSVVAMISKP